MRIIFLGTPDFSVESLKALINSKHDIIAVVTQPDKKRDRNVVSFSPVKEVAVKENIKVLQYEKIRVEGVEELKELNPDLMVTCAYGQIISQEILDIPKHGVINVHASLLPKYRGSSPIQWAILNGEKQTGITIMKTALQVDSGDILIQEKIDILENENAGELFDRLSLLGAKTLMKAIDIIEAGKDEYVKQDESLATHFPMLSKADGKLDFDNDARVILNRINAMNPWPGSFASLNGKMFKIKRAVYSDKQFNTVGQINVVDNEMLVATKLGSLKLLEVQQEGKKSMDAKTFLVGHPNISGEILR